MSTYTFHAVCDVCGKRADVDFDHPNQSVIPEGWRGGRTTMLWGLYCSHACARQAAVAGAMKAADELFAVKVESA